MIGGLPVVSGAFQVQLSEVAVFPDRWDLGLAGAGGGSFTSVTFMVTAMAASVKPPSAMPMAFLASLTLTVTVWEAFASKSSTAPCATLIWPLAAPMVNAAAPLSE